MDLDIPLVIMDRKDLPLQVPKVVLDNENAMSLAVGMLTSKGISNIEMISYTMRVSSISEREKGFRHAMSQVSQDTPATIHRLQFDSINDETDALIPDIVGRGVQGLVFATNALAIAAIKKLSSMGVRVQHDIHVVGFDNSDVYNLFNPPIPHVCQPIDKICSMSFSYLKKLIDKEASDFPKVTYLPGNVVR